MSDSTARPYRPALPGSPASGCAAAARLAGTRRLAALATLCLATAGQVQAQAVGEVDAATAGANLRAQALVAEAGSAVADSGYVRAADLYREALAIDPGNRQARDGLRVVEELLAGRARPERGDLDRGDLRRQLAMVDARQAMERAELLVEAGRYADGRERLEFARAQLAAYADRQDVAGHLQRIETALDALTRRDAAAAEAVARVDREEHRAEAERRSSIEQEAAKGLFRERLARVEGIRKRRHLELALADCRRLVSEFPGEPEAERLFSELLAETHQQRRLDIKERERELRQEIAERIERSLIPTGFDGNPIYPHDWHERHTGASGLTAPTEYPAWHEAILDRLAQRITFDFDALDLVEALEFVGKQGGINLVVDPSLHAAQQVVTLRGSDMRLDSVLNWLTRSAQTKWMIDKGAVYVGGEGVLPGVLRVYDVADIAFVAPDQPGYSLGFNAGEGGGGSSFDLFQEANADVVKFSPEDFVDVIRTAVSPQTWENPDYSITIRGNSLFVTAPQTVHRLLQQFMISQSRARHLLVSVDAKWLMINDGFLEEIGVNWGGAANLLRAPINLVAPGSLYTNNQHSFEGNILHTLPDNSVNINPALAGTGLNLSILRLGATQLSAVLTAVERKSQGRVLASPSVCTINGVRGNCFFGTQIAYISDYEVGGGGGGDVGLGAALEPTIDVLVVGASLDIQPNVSADGKYVTMEFRPALADAQLFLENITAQQVVGQGTDPVTGLPIAGVITRSYPIELPNVFIREVSTTIIVPDKGSLLVGGFGRHIEQEASSKVPFLGHIPYFGRLFGRRGRYSERMQLYLLATVNVINYEEAEAKL